MAEEFCHHRNETSATQERELQKLVEELCRIGRDVRVIRYPGGRKEQVAASGFLRSSGAGELDERARAIGERLNVIGGHDLMLRAHHQLQSALGVEAAHELSVTWRGIGYWGSPVQADQYPSSVSKSKSQNLLELEERLGRDLAFAEFTLQRDGTNLESWMPPLSTEEIRVAVETARIICQPASDAELREHGQDSDEVISSERYLGSVGTGFQELIYLTRRDLPSNKMEVLVPMLVLEESELHWSEFVDPDVEYSWSYDLLAVKGADGAVPVLRLTVAFTKPRSKDFAFFFDLNSEDHRRWLLHLAESQHVVSGAADKAACLMG